MRSDRGGEGENIEICVGATVDIGVGRIEIVGLILCIVEFDPGIGGGEVGAACF